MRHFSSKFNVTELFAFASHPGSGFSASNDLKKKNQKAYLHTILDPFRSRYGFGSCRNHSQHLCSPCLSFLCWSSFSSLLPQLGAGTSLPAGQQMVAVSTGCWAFGYLFFQGRLGGKRRITGCWVFFPNFCGGDCFTSGQESCLWLGAAFTALRAGRGMFPSPVRRLGLWHVCRETLKKSSAGKN